MNEPQLYNFTLSSNSLLSKWGFGDGDQFAEFVLDNNYHVRWTTQEFPIDKEITKRAVERYLLPALPVSVRVECFVTPHNSVRVHPDDYDKLATQPETTVTLTEQQLRDICEEVYREYTKAGSS
jgi:hypothetical protein